MTTHITKSDKTRILAKPNGSLVATLRADMEVTVIDEINGWSQLNDEWISSDPSRQWTLSTGLEPIHTTPNPTPSTKIEKAVVYMEDGTQTELRPVQ